MTSAEKVQRCMDIAPVRDRREIPVLAQIITYAGVCAGYTQKEISLNNKKFQQALKKNRFVKKFRLGQYGEGEDGVTIAEFG